MKILFPFLFCLSICLLAFGQTPVDTLYEPDINIPQLVDQEPIPINFNELITSITYPKELEGTDIYGTVSFRILIDTSGNYVRHKVIKRAHPILENEIASHFPSLKFSPALKDNKKVMCWVSIPFSIHPLRN